MEYQRRIVPPMLEGARPRAAKLRELDEQWEEVEPTSRRPAPKWSSFPPGRSDAEIEAIVDEFTEELCGAYY